MFDAALSPSPSAVRTIAAKDIRDALRDHFILIVAAFLGVAATVALVTGAIALRGDVATYEAAKATLLAIGKSADAIKAPEFYPLRLLRGAVEQIEIIGAAIAILIGYRSAASERGRQTLALIFTRPMHRWQFVAGKALAGLGVLAGGLAFVLGGLTLILHLMSGVGLTADDLLRIAVVWGVAVAYTACFFLLSFILSLHMKVPGHALLAAFPATDAKSVEASPPEGGVALPKLATSPEGGLVDEGGSDPRSAVVDEITVSLQAFEALVDERLRIERDAAEPVPAPA